MCGVQPALSYTAAELVKGAQQSSGGLFSAADVFSLGTCHFPVASTYSDGVLGERRQDT